MSTNINLMPEDINKKSKPIIDDKGKQDYLLDYRNGLWTAIRHKEGGIWQFVSFFAGAIVVIAGILQNKDLLSSLGIIQISLLSTVVILVSFWGLIIILDANYWQSRNLWIISNIEWRFLKDDGIGTIIPKYYATPDFRYANLYAMHMHFLSIIVTFVFVGTAGIMLQAMNILGFQEVVVIGLFGLLVNGFIQYVLEKDNSWVKEYYSVRGSSVGDREKLINYADYNEYKNRVESPILIWFFILSMLFVVFIVKCVSLVFDSIQSNVFFNVLIGITVLLALIVIFVKSIAFKENVSKCKQYIASDITEQELSLKPEFIRVKNISLTVAWVIKLCNWFCIICSALLILKAFLQ